MFSNSEEPENSLTWIEESLRVAALDPKIVLRCSENSTSSDIRDQFRRICLEHLQGSMFTPGSLCKKTEIIKWRVALFSYRHATKQFMAPSDWLGNHHHASFKEIGFQISEPSPLMQAQPQDILMLLRPAGSHNFESDSNGRASKFLIVQCLGFETCVASGVHSQYIFQVDYCMRRSILKKRFSDFLQLQTDLQNEMHVFPRILEGDITHKFLIGNRVERGNALALFVTTVHSIFAERGLFSPRLLSFLGVDALKVHIEEDGCISTIIENPSISPWSIVNDQWLNHWRRFVLSRGPRRYQTPGPITNDELLMFKIAPDRDIQRASDRKWDSWTSFQTGKDEQGKLTLKGRYVPREGLKPSRHYRAVTYNLWSYLHSVYGGGPSISREGKTITSALRLSEVEAAVIIECAIRRKIGRKKYVELEDKTFSSTSEAARTMLFEQHETETLVAADQKADTMQEQRRNNYLNESATFTQVTWKNKKMAAESSKEMEIIKEAQEIHAEYTYGGEEETFDDEPLVVEDVKDIISMKIVEVEDVLFSDQNTFDLGLSQHPATGQTVVTRIRSKSRDFLAPKPGPNQINRIDRKRKMLESFPHLDMLSEIISVNNFPVRSLSHRETVEKIAKTPWPIYLRFRRPLRSDEVTGVFDLPSITNLNVRQQAFKLLLRRGLELNLHEKGQKAFPSRLLASSICMSWESIPQPQFSLMARFIKKEGPWKTRDWKKVLSMFSPNELAPFNGQRVTEGNYQYFRTFDELGIRAEDQERLFNAVTKWTTDSAISEMMRLNALNLYDLIAVKRGKSTATGFSKSVRDEHCFTLHFEKPSRVFRVGDQIAGKNGGLVTAVMKTTVEIGLNDGTSIVIPKSKAHSKLVGKQRSLLKRLPKFTNSTSKDLQVVLCFEIPEPPNLSKPKTSHQNGGEATAARQASRDVVVGCLRKIVAEIKETQYVVGTKGVPVRRVAPQRELISIAEEND